jgi:predicted enzyme related to lactoylglutathione lyase
MKVFRLTVPASSIELSRRFYERLLNIAADDTVPSRLYFHCGEVIVAVIDWSVEGEGPLRPNPDNVYFATGELEAAFGRAGDAGAEITSPIERRPWGERSFYCLDPDGNPLCFVDERTLFLGQGASWR